MSATSSSSSVNRIPARYFALLVSLLASRGVDVEAVLQNANIWPTQLEGPDATISLVQMERLIEEAQRTGGPDVALEFGRSIKLSTHEILGYGLLTSPTLDYAMQLAARYYRLITPTFRMLYMRGPEHSELRFQPVVPLSPEALQFMIELVVVSAYEQMRTIAGAALRGCDIHVSYPAPGDVSRYRVLRPARFLFESGAVPGARMVMEVDTSVSLPMADASARKMAEARCEQLLRTTSQAGRMTEWITMMLRESQDGMPSLADLARLLNQSVRTLDRQLGREGQRFLDLSKRVRHEKACSLLRGAPDLSVTQIAYQLGYGDVANFTRAFKRDSGVSPSAFRDNGV